VVVVARARLGAWPAAGGLVGGDQTWRGTGDHVNWR
jgi:hypothetical protein